MTSEERELLVGEILERVFTSLPKMVDLYLSQTDAIRRIAQDFYNRNPELLKHKYAVSKRLNELMSEQPEGKVEDLLEIVGKEFTNSLKDIPPTTPSDSPVPGPIGSRRKVEPSRLKNMDSLLRGGS